MLIEVNQAGAKRVTVFFAMGGVMSSRYQVVCAVVDRGSLKAAADELGYTQSAVSQAVKALERELGTTILERGKQGVSLTRDGEQYLPYLRQIVTAEAELEGKR